MDAELTITVFGDTEAEPGEVVYHRVFNPVNVVISTACLPWDLIVGECIGGIDIDDHDDNN